MLVVGGAVDTGGVAGEGEVCVGVVGVGGAGAAEEEGGKKVLVK